MTEIKKLRKPVLSFQLISEGIVRQLHQPVVHGARQFFQSPAPDKKYAVISTGPGPAGVLTSPIS
jgi:isopenicillin N synthase-like dioxygenase